MIPLPKTDAQELNVSMRDAKRHQTFDYILTPPAAH
jgi:hypothetical protein